MTGPVLERDPPVTRAGVRAVLLGAASIIERCGFCQGPHHFEDLTGGVSVLRALALAADGDTEAERLAIFEVELLLGTGHDHSDLTAWADRPQTTRRGACKLLRFTARHLDRDLPRTTRAVA